MFFKHQSSYYCYRANDTLHSTPSSQRIVAPSPPPRLTEILEFQKKLETLLMSVLERLESLENRTLTSTSSTASSGKDEVKRRVHPELSVSVIIIL